MGEGKEGRKVRLTSRKPLALCIVPVRYVLYVPDGSSQLLWAIQTWKKRRTKLKTCLLIEFKRLAWDGWMDGWMDGWKSIDIDIDIPQKEAKYLVGRKQASKENHKSPPFEVCFRGKMV